jgi:hypothetical protein
LAQAGETRDGVEHGVLRVRELLLDVLLLGGQLPEGAVEDLLELA